MHRCQWAFAFFIPETMNVFVVYLKTLNQALNNTKVSKRTQWLDRIQVITQTAKQMVTENWNRIKRDKRLSLLSLIYGVSTWWKGLNTEVFHIQWIDIAVYWNYQVFWCQSIWLGMWYKRLVSYFARPSKNSRPCVWLFKKNFYTADLTPTHDLPVGQWNGFCFLLWTKLNKYIIIHFKELL